MMLLLTTALLDYLSSNHLIRPLQHAAWNCQSDLFRCLQIDDKLKLRCLLHRQISRLGTFQDLVHASTMMT